MGGGRKGDRLTSLTSIAEIKLNPDDEKAQAAHGYSGSLEL